MPAACVLHRPSAENLPGKGHVVAGKRPRECRRETRCYTIRVPQLKLVTAARTLLGIVSEFSGTGTCWFTRDVTTLVKKFRTSRIFRCGRYDKRCSTWWRKNSSLSACLSPPHPPRHSGHLSATRKGQLMKTVQPGQAPASAAGRAHEDGKARAGTGECRG
uniref:Uncharacterized protein n=1 Tax=Branchiostoma floridae TaxID=7739 RepID=C3YV33_BRAFL|eukprot:XP_002599884.1 hypothetical protein BRAFLDRAFT_127649 [Branchiostoma floridae]